MQNNFDENTMNNIKNLVNNGDISQAISQISPEMIENFSKMMNNNSSQNASSTNSNTYKQNTKNQSTQNNYSNSTNSENTSSLNFDFSKIDVNTIMKMKSVIEKMNNSNDPRSNLLYSLKPYLRESKQEKIDQYANLLNFSQVAELLKNDNSFKK